jgi:hypothetical protein
LETGWARLVASDIDEIESTTIASGRQKPGKCEDRTSQAFEHFAQWENSESPL